MRSGPGEGAPTVVASIAPCTIVVSAATSAFGARTPASRASSRWRRVYEWNGELGKQAPVEQAQTMKRIVGFFAQHLAPHAKWEEAHLYVGRSPRRRRPEPVRRRCASSTGRSSGGSASCEALRGSAPDAVAFARRTDQLLGLVTAHFEAEEEVLLPVAIAR